MSISEYLERYQLININILKFIDMESDIEENYQNIITILEDQKIRENIHETKLIIRMISTIANTHRHSTNFYNKIDKLILYFKNEIISDFKKNEICKIFNFNKRIVLFLIKEKMAVMDEELANELIKLKYQKYFYPEMKALQDELKNQNNNNDDNQKITDKFDDDYDDYDYDDNKSDIESSDVFDSQEGSYDENLDEINSDNDEKSSKYKFMTKKRRIFRQKKRSIRDYDVFSDSEYDFVLGDFLQNGFKKKEELKIDDEKRMIGENDNEICEIIRNDLIEEFIIYVNKNDIPLKMEVEKSIYESDIYLCKVSLSLIDYAVYFGAVQIFKYLYFNGAAISSNGWFFSIHSDNEEMIHFFEEQNIEISDENNNSLYVYAIKCHHNDVARYFDENYLKDEFKENDSYHKIYWIQYYNFSLFQYQMNDLSYNKTVLSELIDYDYYTLVEFILKENKVEINENIIDTYDYDSLNKKMISITTPLLKAVENQNVDMVRLFLNQKDIDVNIELVELFASFSFRNNQDQVEFRKDKSALQIALESKNIEIFKLLLNCPDIDVNNKYLKSKNIGTLVNGQVSYDGENARYEITQTMSLLNIALLNKNFEFAELLLMNKNIDVNSDDMIILSSESRIIYKPLIVAINSGNTKIIELMLSNPNIDINCKSKKIIKKNLITEKTALFAAMENGCIDFIKNLLSRPEIEVNSVITKRTHSNKNITKRTVLYEAVKKRLIEIVKLLLTFPNIDTNIKTFIYDKKRNSLSEKTALCAAIKNKDFEMVKLLLSNLNTDVNCKLIKTIKDNKYIFKRPILYYAVERKLTNIVHLLLSNPSIDVNAKSFRISRFKSSGVKKTEVTILYKAIEVEDPTIVKLLLSNQNIDVNEKSIKTISFNEKDGNYVKYKTPLHAAVLEKNIEIIELLLNNKNIDINVKDEYNKSAIELTDDDKIKLLFKELIQ